MAEKVSEVIEVAPDFQVKRNKNGITTKTGVAVTKIAKAIFDTASTDSSGAANTTVAAHGLNVFIPPTAIVKRAWYQVKTAATSATSAATIAVSIEGANDVVSAIAISDASTPWAAGIHDAIQVGTAATMIETTVEREVTATVAVEALTAGKIIFFVEYVEAL